MRWLNNGRWNELRDAEWVAQFLLALYPALHRMEQSGWIRSEWKLTETNRKAKYYRLTAAGQKELPKAEEGFEQLVKGVRAVLRYAQG